MLFDIFSKKQKKENSAKKPIIIADIHEKNSLVLANISSKCELEIKSLEVGDYIVGNFVIERKTSQDFISSMLSKRLQEQLKNLEQIKNKMLIIEGKFEDIKNIEKTKLNPNSIRGQILAVLNYYKVPIIFTRDSEETAEYLTLLAKQQLKPLEELSRHSRKPASIQEQKQYIVEAFPGIGPKTAKELLKKFKSIKNIINASEEELKEIIGKKAESFRIINESYV